MKRYGHLWEELISFENFLRAYRKARRGKRGQQSVERFEFHRETEVERLRRQVAEGRYRPGRYRTFLLHDTKPRIISAAPFRDRVVHHTFCNIVEPIFERTFIRDSYASRKGKGTHAAIKRYQSFARQNAYVFKGDVRKFFPSVDHEILLTRLNRKIKDQRVLDLAASILASSESEPAMACYFAGDDLFGPSERMRGLPIGNQTSQFFGNVYLDALDHFVKEVLRCRHYVRYVDDFVILGPNSKSLADVREAVEDFLTGLRLKLHPEKRVISRTGEGIRFLGLRVLPNQVLLPRDAARRARRRFGRYSIEFSRGEIDLTTVRQRVHSWLGHTTLIHGDQYARDLLTDIVFSRSAAE